jgi:hypothetical protein
MTAAAMMSAWPHGLGLGDGGAAAPLGRAVAA